MSPAQWAEETCNTEQAGVDNTRFTLLLALGQEKPNDELNIFFPLKSKTQFKTISSSESEPDGHPWTS